MSPNNRPRKQTEAFLQFDSDWLDLLRSLPHLTVDVTQQFKRVCSGGDEPNSHVRSEGSSFSRSAWWVFKLHFKDWFYNTTLRRWFRNAGVRMLQGLCVCVKVFCRLSSRFFQQSDFRLLILGPYETPEPDTSEWRSRSHATCEKLDYLIPRPDGHVVLWYFRSGKCLYTSLCFHECKCFLKVTSPEIQRN